MQIWRMRRRLPRAAVALLMLVLAQLALAAPAHAWWNSDWSYRVRIDADTTPKGANVTTVIGSSKVLLRLHSGNFNFATAKDDGSDLRILAADDRTPLHFQIEKFDGLVDQVGLIWVDVPDLAPSAVTSLYLYWGNKNATSSSDGKATFAKDAALVYHFDEDNGIPRDTTANGNNAQTGGHRVDGGMIGYGLHLDGTAPIRLPASPSLATAAGQATTWSVWVHPDDAVQSAVIYDSKSAGGELAFGIDHKAAYAQLTTAGAPRRIGTGAPLGAGWHLFTLTAGDRLTLYVDGLEVGHSDGALPALDGPSLLGGAPAPTPATAPTTPGTALAPATPPPADPTLSAPAAIPPLVGTIDEFRITRALVAPGAMLVAVRADGPSPALLILQTPEQSSVFGSGYIGIILRSVTPDAWVVIGILGVMSLISWAVMVGKAVYVTRVQRANHVFRNAYRGQVYAGKGNLLGVMRQMSQQNATGWHRSTLFRLNQVATHEIDDRLNGGRVDANGMMPPQSIAAIRSALDARMATEVQHLNRMMVLLTIAIAGGPFIGLLGTVIGVMITFAAIAQAGDVNVNAIAPGISAALLATVAGLAVAIPALFGYNYFNSRITDAISDMAVHIDTLVTRMGEGLLSGHQPAGE